MAAVVPAIARARRQAGKAQTARLAQALVINTATTGPNFLELSASEASDSTTYASPACSDVDSPPPRLGSPAPASCSADEFALLDDAMACSSPRSWNGEHKLFLNANDIEATEMACIGIQDVHGSMEAAFQDFDCTALDAVLPQVDGHVDSSVTAAAAPMETVSRADMESVLAAVWASPPAARDDGTGEGVDGDGDVTIRLQGVMQSFVKLAGQSPQQVKQEIATAFGLGSQTFVLRTHDGIIVPTSSELPHDGPLSVVLVDCKSHAVPAEQMLPREEGPGEAGTATMQFVQEPPKGSCEWLTCKVIKSGEARPLQHLFSVEVEISDAGKFSESELRERLLAARIRLFTPSMQEKTHLVHQGAKVVMKDERGKLHVRWAGVGIKEVSSTQSGGDGVGKLALGRTGGRCAAGWYHMAISAEGCADLWLRSSTDLTEPGLAKVVVKHKRCYKTGRWEEKRIGPYADHRYCIPSHVDTSGRRLCCEGGC